MQSSWIRDVQPADGGAMMSTASGKRYFVSGVTPTDVREWTKARSAGEFFNKHIRKKAAMREVR